MLIAVVFLVQALALFLAGYVLGREAGVAEQTKKFIAARRIQRFVSVPRGPRVK